MIVIPVFLVEHVKKKKKEMFFFSTKDVSCM